MILNRFISICPILNFGNVVIETMLLLFLINLHSRCTLCVGMLLQRWSDSDSTTRRWNTCKCKPIHVTKTVLYRWWKTQRQLLLPIVQL